MLCTMPVWGLMTFCVGEEIYIHSLPRNERVEYLQRKLEKLENNLPNVRQSFYGYIIRVKKLKERIAKYNIEK